MGHGLGRRVAGAGQHRLHARDRPIRVVLSVSEQRGAWRSGRGVAMHWKPPLRRAPPGLRTTGGGKRP